MTRWQTALLAIALAALVGFTISIFAIPRVLMYVAAARIGTEGTNVMKFAEMKTPENREIIRPAADLLYGSCVIDLSQGPVRVSVPATPAPYWSLSVFDRSTDVAFVRNNLDTDGEALSIVVAAPDHVVEGGDTPVVRAPEGPTVATLRILMDNPANYAAIDRVRRSASCMPV